MLYIRKHDSQPSFTFTLKAYTMSVTLDIPSHILEQASNYAASEGISLDTLIARTLVIITNQTHPAEQKSSDTPQNPIQKMGLMPDAVLYIADDFDAIPEGFEDYI